MSHPDPPKDSYDDDNLLDDSIMQAEKAFAALSDSIFCFTVPGPPKAKERPRFNMKTGRVFTPKTSRAYEQNVAASAIEAGAHRRMDETSSWGISMNIFFPDLRRRDLDNVVKAILDGLNRVVWWDDSQVVSMTTKKALDRDNPRVEVSLTHDPKP